MGQVTLNVNLVLFGVLMHENPPTRSWNALMKLVPDGVSIGWTPTLSPDDGSVLGYWAEIECDGVPTAYAALDETGGDHNRCRRLALCRTLEKGLEGK